MNELGIPFRKQSDEKRDKTAKMNVKTQHVNK